MDRWLFPIIGRPEDIANLRDGLRVGPQRLEDHADEHGTEVCLSDRRIDPSKGGVEALEAAKNAVEHINSIFSFRRGSIYKPVTLTGAVYEGMLDGSRRARPLAIVRLSMRSRATFVPTAPDPTILVAGVPIPSWEELYLAAEEVEPLFREARRFAQGSFEQVCRAFETIKRRGKPGKEATRDGARYIEQQGWLTAAELTDLYQTCAVVHHGLPSAPIKSGAELSLEQARSLVRQLLDRWAEELAAGSPHVMSDLRP
jgi:hypothetical protein